MTGYTLIRSRRRTLAVEITREGGVTVRAPRLCPQRAIDEFLSSREAWIEKHIEKQKLRVQKHPEPDEAGKAALIAAAREKLPPRVEHYAALMGLRPAGVTVTGARTRFGSCSAKNRLSFSWRLMEYPPEAVDYVVVHEIAHIAHKNHGAGFYALIGEFLPDWRERRKLLKE